MNLAAFVVRSQAASDVPRSPDVASSNRRTHRRNEIGLSRIDHPRLTQEVG